MEYETGLLLEPKTLPITHESLLLEVKGIYAGLLMVESKCVEVDTKQSKEALDQDPSRPRILSNVQWRALISLHTTLLHEHHDFFLASQHPSANPALTKLPEHYSMPARMWRHGIHTFLELLRFRLPDSFEHMLQYIILAYSMIALLFETVSIFETTWMECLGDLARYRMAIENNLQDREIWSGVARSWYAKGVDRNPEQGRLYHHLAILARRSSLQQLSFYLKALTCEIPFESARTGIMTLFNPILRGKAFPYLVRSAPFERNFIKAHAMLFSGTALDNFDATLSRLIDLLGRYITKLATKYKEQGMFIAIANLAALFEYCGDGHQTGTPKSLLRLCFKSLRDAEDKAIEEAKVGDAELALLDVEFTQPVAPHIGNKNIVPSELESSLRFITRALKLAFGTFSTCLQQVRDRNVIPLIGVYFVFLWDLTRIDDLHGVKTLINKEVPWREMCSFLNKLARPETLTFRVRAPHFPKYERPLPEDFLMRGQSYFPSHRFSQIVVDEEERAIEIPSNGTSRMQRILWLGFHMASSLDNKFIYFDERSQKFTPVDPAQNAEISNSVRTKEQPRSIHRSPEEHESVVLDLSDLKLSKSSEGRMALEKSS